MEGTKQPRYLFIFRNLSSRSDYECLLGAKKITSTFLSAHHDKPLSSFLNLFLISLPHLQ